MNFSQDMLNVSVASGRRQWQAPQLPGLELKESFNKSAFGESWAKPGWMGTRKALKKELVLQSLSSGAAATAALEGGPEGGGF